MLTSIVLILLLANIEACPPWTSFNNNSHQCECEDGLKGVVHCKNNPYQLSVQFCYCMTYNVKLNEVLVGTCIYGCKLVGVSGGCVTHHSIVTNNSEMINNETCGEYNRDGQLCGNCKEGYGPPVYSYSLKCVKCKKSDFKSNLLKYIAVAFIPLTGFYLLVMLFKIRVTSTPAVVFILTSQILAAPFIPRYILMPSHKPGFGVKAAIAFFAVWNLDILRSLYSPFCIHPSMTTLHVLALDYLIGIYPLVLIAATYIAVMLHDRYPLVVRIWRPVNQLCRCIRQEWNIRGSLVQAFATFLVLSYVKILNVSFDLLTPVELLRQNRRYLPRNYLYYAGEIPYFGEGHFPFNALAIFMLVIFNILPMLLLLLYQFSCFQKCLSTCRLNSLALHIFMDTFQGCYRHELRDCRWFASLYLFVRFFQLLIFVGIRDIIYLPVTGLCLMLLTALLIVVKPYKRDIQNTIDAVIFLIHALVYMMTGMYLYMHFIDPHLPSTKPYSILVAIFLSLFALCVFGLGMRKLIPSVVMHYFKKCISLLREKFSSSGDIIGSEESFPYSFERDNEYRPLLN